MFVAFGGGNDRRMVEAAVKWLSLSAEKGNPYAQYRLGMLYLKGEEYSPQVEVAMKWLQQAAEQKTAAVGRVTYTTELFRTAYGPQKHRPKCDDPSGMVYLGNGLWGRYLPFF